MFQLSLSTILTSPTTPGAGLIPALSGDFSAALAGVVDAAAAPGATLAAPGLPRQTDAEPGKSLPIAAQTAPAADTAADEELERVIATAGEADKLAISQPVPAQAPATTITATPPVAVAPATTQVIVVAGAPASPVSSGATPQPSTPKLQASQQAASDTTTIEASAANIVIAPSGVVPTKTNPVAAKRGDPKKSADGGDERRDEKPVEGASQPAASVMAIAVAPIMPSPVGDPVPAQTVAARTTLGAEAALPMVDAADVESAPARPDAPIITANATAPAKPHAVAANVAAPAADALVQGTPPIAAASPALVGTGPAVSPTAHAAPALPAAAPPVVMPAAAASAASAPPHIAPAASSLPAQPVEAASITRLATDGATKPDAPAAPAVTSPTPAAPTPQLAQPAAIAFGVAFGGIVPGQRPSSGDRPSPREQALQALTALAGATPAASVAATAQPQHNALDMRRDDWPQAMIERIEALRDAADATSTRITLVPDALGKVDLSIRHDGSTVHVHFAADAAQTRAILADAQPRLAELAQQRGFRLGQATVDAGASGGGQHQQPQAAAPPPQRPASAFVPTPADADAADSTRLA
jgi:flagellar hook-length control protein FliK